MNRIVAICLAVLATPAAAQQECPAGVPAPDPCLAGHWIGQNTAAERINAMLARMAPPGSTRDIITPPAPTILAISIYADGFYITLPVHQNVMWQDISENDSVLVTMDLTMGTALGHIWNEGDRLRFCTIPHEQAMLRTEAISSLAGSATSTVMPGLGGGPGFTPEMTYHCAGGGLEIEVNLPEPVGPVHYSMRRISESRLPEEFRDLTGMGDLAD